MKKEYTFTVTIGVNPWMTRAMARREARTLLNDACSWYGQGPDGEEIGLKVRKIS